MTRALLYARYSTAMQSQASVEDQLRLLRQRAAREGWEIAGEHADRAISGTVRDRPGLLAAMAAIRAGEAAVLLAESLDRLSRDQEDIAGLFKRVRHAGARIVTLSEGEIGTLHIGMGGTMSALFLEQLADKVRRGLVGVVEDGRVPGGLSYGYRAVRRLGANGEVERGLREIDAHEAAVVVEIFESVAAGKSAIAIAKALNAAGEPGPRGGLWRANTITGNRDRGIGILHNPLYRGRIVFNRQTFRKDPETRRRVARATAPGERIEREVPELRIVDEALWNAAHARLEANRGKRPEQCRRAKWLLSGLMRCGCCGGGMVVVSTGRWGCSNYRQTGTCDNRRTLVNAEAERRVLAAVQSHLLHPDVVAAYLDEWRLAMAERRRDAIASGAKIERRLAELEREEQRITAAIVAGLPLESLQQRAEALAAERAALRRERAEAAPAAPEAAIHPGTADHYRRRVGELHELVAENPELVPESRDLLASLIDHIEVVPPENPYYPVRLTLHGDLAALLQLGAPKAQKPAAPESSGPCTLTMVAGVGFGRWRTMRIAA